MNEKKQNSHNQGYDMNYSNGNSNEYNDYDEHNDDMNYGNNGNNNYNEPYYNDQNYYNNFNNQNFDGNYENQNYNYNNKKNNNTTIFIIIGIVVAIIGYYVATNYIFIDKFDISNYYTVNVDGISGEAKAEILPKEATGDESKKSSNLKLKNFLDKANIKFELSKSEGIQNGDVIQVNAIYDTRLAKFNKIKVINDKFEIKVSDLPNPVKDISEVKNLSQIKKLYENYFISELGRRTDYYSTLYEILGMYSGKDSNGQVILRIYGKIKSRNMYYDGKAVEYDYLELSNLMQNSNNEITSATRTTITSDSNLNGEMNSQEMDSRLRLEGFSKVN